MMRLAIIAPEFETGYPSSRFSRGPFKIKSLTPFFIFGRPLLALVLSEPAACIW